MKCGARSWRLCAWCVETLKLRRGTIVHITLYNLTYVLTSGVASHQYEYNIIIDCGLTAWQAG